MMRKRAATVKHSMPQHMASTRVKANGLILASGWRPGRDQVNREKVLGLVCAGADRRAAWEKKRAGPATEKRSKRGLED
jgi:hypothetical protein